VGLQILLQHPYRVRLILLDARNRLHQRVDIRLDHLVMTADVGASGGRGLAEEWLVLRGHIDKSMESLAFDEQRIRWCDDGRVDRPAEQRGRSVRTHRQ